ncbi:MAG: peptidoglycan-binding protein [Clostridiales bacterium]|nr:peptidoglycan-binding protein [Clostridiales bacterium]
MWKKHILRVAALTLALALLTSSGLALTLRYPQQGDDVAELQRALKQLGYYKNTIDGEYGTGTLNAVRAFQKANGLTSDGVAGETTLAKIEALTGISIGGEGGSGSSGESKPSTGLFSGVYTTIEYGQKGDRVKTLQQALKALGYAVSKVDGNFGSGTLSAVKAFQSRHDLITDGKAGKKTLQKLETYFDQDGNLISGPVVTNPPADDKEENGYNVPTRTLRYGMSGDDVAYTQQRLYSLGYFTGTRDGQFGSGTLSAVKAFQRKNGLTSDGVVGPATIKVLFSSGALAAEEATQAPTQKPTPTPTPSPTPGATPSRTLRYGASGEDVKLLQNRLIDLGYLSGKADGTFGSTTLAAVKAFQKNNALTQDGVAGTQTYKKLFSSSARPAETATQAPTQKPTPTPTPTPTSTPSPTPGATPSRTLRYGYTGEDVRLLQNRLIELGYLSGKADGTFGSTTLTAVKAFQKNNGLTQDGVAGTQTYKKLFSASAVEATPVPGDSSDIPTRTLTIGDSGDDVKSVQRRLKALLYLNGTVDGQYGATTAAAMKAFQQMNQLTASGDGNLATYARLYSDDAINAQGVRDGENASAYVTLRSGATGAAVIRLQQKLADLDYDVQVTGTYDAQTIQAVRSFQSINGLSVDGVAGKNTQTKLYSGTAKRFPAGPEGAIYGSMGYVAAPAKSQIKLLHWANDIKSTLSNGQALLAYDPATGISWSLTIIARGRHCDVEPSTKADTAAMNAAFGGKVTWTPKPVYIRLPSGTCTVATTHNVPHGINPIKDNDFEGQNCVHFLRDMSEAEKNDPDYGVTNQKALRQFWYDLTGETIAYK